MLRMATEATTLPKIRVLDLATARFQSHIIYALTRNNVFDAVHPAPLTCKATAAQLKLHEPFLCRLMDAGTTLGLLSKSGDKYGTTDASALIVRDAPSSMKSFVEMINNPEISAGWDAIGSESLKSGEGGFETAYQESFWQRLSSRPHLEKQFDAAMSSFTAVSAGALGPVHEHARARARARALASTRALARDAGGGRLHHLFVRLPAKRHSLRRRRKRGRHPAAAPRALPGRAGGTARSRRDRAKIA